MSRVCPPAGHPDSSTTSRCSSGCRLQCVQVATVARRPPDPAVTALSPDELEVIARAVREQCPGLPVETYGEEGGPA